MFVKQMGYICINKYKAEGKGKKRLNVWVLLGMSTGVRKGNGKSSRDRRQTDKMPLAAAQKGERTEEGRERPVRMGREHQTDQLLKRKNPNGEGGSDV